MITVKEAKKLVLEHTTPLASVSLDLRSACGHILARDIYAEYDIPAFRQSSVDGYALKLKQLGQPLKLAGETAAGISASTTLQPGQTIRIFTGAPVPEGADAVCMQEKATRCDDAIILEDQQLGTGANIREKGSEIKSGTLAIGKNKVLSPAAIGFLAGIGISTAEVLPMPKVAIIVTGNELQQPGQKLHFGQVYESNSYSLSAALGIEGINKIQILEAKDDLDELTVVLKTALEAHDVILLTGGVSVGDYDFVVQASASCGVEQVFHKVRQKPGKPLYFGKKSAKLIFGLPGNPSSVLSCYYNYVLPALKHLSGKENSIREIQAELTDSYTKVAGLTHFLKGSYQNGKAKILTAQESFRMGSFAEANCLICIDEDQQEVSAGTIVTLLLLPD